MKIEILILVSIARIALTDFAQIVKIKLVQPPIFVAIAEQELIKKYL